MTDPISDKMIQEFGLPQEYKMVSKHAVLYANSADVYNQNHRKFDIKFLKTPEEEVEAAEVFIYR